MALNFTLFLDGGSGDIARGKPRGGGTPGSGTGSGKIPTGVPGNPFASENGGVTADTWLLFSPVQDVNTGNCYIGFYDTSTFDDPIDGSTYSYRSEDIIILRQPTVRRVGLIYRDLGLAKLTVQLSGTNDNGEVVTQTVSVQLGNKVPTNALITKFVDIQLTCFRPQLTLIRAAGGGPVSITSVTLIGEVEEVQL